MYDGSAIVLNVPMGARNKSSLTTPTHVVNGRQKKEKEKNRGRNRLTKRTREAASDRTVVVWTCEREETGGSKPEGQGHGRDQCLCPLPVGANAKPTEPYCRYLTVQEGTARGSECHYVNTCCG
jgi:hypothetical protein